MSRFPLPPGLSPGDIGRNPDDGTDTGDGESQTVSIYFYVWCVYADESTEGPYTQTVDVPSDVEVGFLHDIVDELANQFCRRFEVGGFGLAPSQGAIRTSWEIFSPAYYQYYRGF
jgi:hypothetical protein